MPSHAIDWTLAGSDNQPILGTIHVPAGPVRGCGVLVICHGFKGYKDYGFFPLLAETAAELGLLAVRFNFSHGGMANNLAAFDRSDMFERPDLFERDTWSKQVRDLRVVTDAVRLGRLPGVERPNLPVVYFGHSRGGVTALLAAAGMGVARDDAPPPAPTPGPISAVVTASAPDTACSLSEKEKEVMRRQGFLQSPSSRTGQILRVGRRWLSEIEAAPAAFDPLRAAAAIACPMLVIHGDVDQTVSSLAATHIAQAAGPKASVLILPGASHTFNAPNPLPHGIAPPPATAQMIDAVCAFAARACRG
ncbi:MAG: alpha/beta fold hydrolase [Microbacteriaceae bacterium]|nr:alpha/beta fold hydrolase [Microbacteriaceae bacterium]